MKRKKKKIIELFISPLPILHVIFFSSSLESNDCVYRTICGIVFVCWLLGSLIVSTKRSFNFSLFVWSCWTHTCSMVPCDWMVYGIRIESKWVELRSYHIKLQHRTNIKKYYLVNYRLKLMISAWISLNLCCLSAVLGLHPNFSTNDDIKCICFCPCSFRPFFLALAYANR